MNSPKILVFDIETTPITSYTWGLYDQNVGLNQIKTDWSILAFAAKWLGDSVSNIIYVDNRTTKDVSNDFKVVSALWKLLDQADIVIAQNGDQFDIKKFNARAVIHGLPPVNCFKSTDTLKESRKVFSFTSHSLEYMTNVLNTKYKKLKHEKYPGFELWKAILAGDQKAWQEMKVYCINDVLATEELYVKIQGWIKTQNLACYFEDLNLRCSCGSLHLRKHGFRYSSVGKYQGYICKECGKRLQGKQNLFPKEKRASLVKESKNASK